MQPHGAAGGIIHRGMFAGYAPRYKDRDGAPHLRSRDPPLAETLRKQVFSGSGIAHAVRAGRETRGLQVGSATR